ncbi:MAG: hypothetical protein GC168_07180 [Candidatus Hydrogenedens sp.]|nr:hypothetical protein [Candidatus Hydrogenedens sp.]
MIQRTLTLLLAVLAVLPAGADGMVLCLGGDGHVALERECLPSTCCDETPAPVEPEPCTDIPLPIGGDFAEALPAAAPYSAPAPQVPAAAVTMLELPLAPSAPGLVPVARHTLPPQPFFQRTACLLI